MSIHDVNNIKRFLRGDGGKRGVIRVMVLDRISTPIIEKWEEARNEGEDEAQSK